MEQYNNLFTVAERKQIIAETMTAMRKDKGISQKEAAAAVGVSQTAYSAWECGRNEPPVEMLVRLSYLFDCTTDLLLQRDMQFRTLQGAEKQLEEFKAQFAELDEYMKDNGNVTPEIMALRNAMGALVDSTLDYAQQQSDKQ